MRLGTGVSAKTAAVAIWSVVVLGIVAIWMPTGPEKLPVILIIAGFPLIYLVGTWIHTTINPHESLEGPNAVAYWQGLVTAKDRPDLIEGSATVIRDPLAAISDQTDKTIGP